VKLKKLDKAVPFIYQPVILIDKEEKYIFFKFPHIFFGENVSFVIGVKSIRAFHSNQQPKTGKRGV
jgi:hypothetical protein